jgi:hypothetical protein
MPQFACQSPLSTGIVAIRELMSAADAFLPRIWLRHLAAATQWLEVNTSCSSTPG